MEARFQLVYGAAETIGVYGAGALAFIDAGPGGGLLPCKVISVAEPGRGNRATGGRIVAKLTATRGQYRRGEVMTEPAWAIVPRGHVKSRRGGLHTIDTRYAWK